MAARKVFDIPELLESILSFLPARDLICAKMVSRYVCDIITQSTRLHHQLCLTPAGPATNHPDEWNPCLFFEQSIIIGAERSDYTIRLPIEQLYEDRNNTVKPSCLRMFITQPPVISAHISWSYILPENPPRKENRGKTLRIQSGITIGDVVETCWEHVDGRSELVLERSQIWVWGTRQPSFLWLQSDDPVETRYF